MTAIEFIKDARGAVGELFRVTKPGGLIVVATLNSLCPWAERRKVSGEKGHSIFQEAVFKSPEEMMILAAAGPCNAPRARVPYLLLLHD